MSDKELYDLQKECQKYKYLEKGWEYQDFVMMALLKVGITLQCYQSKAYQTKYGESLNGIEIKYDKKLQDTGNIYIEVESRSPYYTNQWTPSGIMCKDKSWLYLIGDYNEIFIFGKKTLKRYVNSGKFKYTETETSKGWLIPRQTAVELAEKYIQIGR